MRAGCRAGRQRQRVSATEQDQQASPADEISEQKSTYGEADVLLRLTAVSFAGKALVIRQHEHCNACLLTPFVVCMTLQPNSDTPRCLDAGAAVVKYGELLLGDIPFSHDLRLALVMIFGPCIVFSLMLANRSKS